MSSPNHEQRYTTVSIALHWLMLVLIVAVYGAMELHEYFPKGSALRTGLKNWHFMLGLTVLVLVVFRLLARSFGSYPQITPAPPAWQQKLAHCMHAALYGLMFCMPILGWLTLSAAGKPIPFFAFELPGLVAPAKALARQLKEIHEVGAGLGYFLIALHAAAGLVHHYYLRDDTLMRILPRRFDGRRDDG